MMNAEAASNRMNDENNNNNDFSSSDNHIGDDNINPKQGQAWGTWEELLLACAVKRHGLRDWDSVAMEVQARSSLPRLLTTAQNCQHKYRDLKRRFRERPAEDDGDEHDVQEEGEGKSEIEDGEDKVDTIPWLEQLRSLRVSELRRELQQYDVSILSLQLKVKKLEEERERSVVDQKPDLGDDLKRERSENDGNEPARPSREKAVSAAEESDRENRSINESNSTASGGKSAADKRRVGGEGTGQGRNDSRNPDPDPVCKAAQEGSLSRGSEVSHSGELGESGSSAGLGRTWKRKGRTNRSGKESLGGGGEIGSVAGKSQPLIGFLDTIRAHPRGSLFERRLPSQETKECKSLIRQHLDLGTIQKRLNQGSYSSSTLSFYRDLLLLFTNAIVFFPKLSSESLAAHELRTLVSDKIKEGTRYRGPSLPDRAISVAPRSDASLDVKPDPEASDSSHTRQKSTAPPLVVCRKRSSVPTRPSPSSSFSQKEDKKSEEVSGEKDKIVTSVRSSRRTNKGVSAIANNTKTGSAKNNKKQTVSKTNSSNDNKQETPKTDKKALASDKKKSVADFLKRIKKNSPANSPKKGGSTGKDQKKSGANSKKDTKAKQRELRSNNADKKKAEENNTPLKRNTVRQQRKEAEAAASSGKRGRETSGGSGKDSKQPKKRSRR